MAFPSFALHVNLFIYYLFPHTFFLGGLTHLCNSVEPQNFFINFSITSANYLINLVFFFCKRNLLIKLCIIQIGFHKKSTKKIKIKKSAVKKKIFFLYQKDFMFIFSQSQSKPKDNRKNKEFYFFCVFFSSLTNWHLKKFLLLKKRTSLESILVVYAARFWIFGPHFN